MNEIAIIIFACVMYSLCAIAPKRAFGRFWNMYLFTLGRYCWFLTLTGKE